MATSRGWREVTIMMAICSGDMRADFDAYASEMAGGNEAWNYLGVSRAIWSEACSPLTTWRRRRRYFNKGTSPHYSYFWNRTIANVASERRSESIRNEWKRDVMSVSTESGDDKIRKCKKSANAIRKENAPGWYRPMREKNKTPYIHYIINIKASASVLISSNQQIMATLMHFVWPFA